MKQVLRNFVAWSALLPVLAFGGATQPAPVMIDLVNRAAQGDMWTARSSKNANELIGCGVRTFDNGGGGQFEFGFCQAVDADGVEAFCFTESPELADAVKAISDYSFITFSWDEDGECTRIGSSTQSFYLPRHTTKGEPDEDD